MSSRIFRIALLSVAFSVAALADGPRFAADRPIDMRHIRLELNVDVAAKHVEGVATLQMTPLREVSSARLDAVKLKTQAVTVALNHSSPVAAEYTNDDKQIEVFFDRPVPRGSEITIEVQYSVDDPAQGLHFFGPSADDPEVPLQMWSQGETSESRFWFPSFDRPNERQTTEIIATVDDPFQVISNGRLVSSASAEDSGKVVYHWTQDQPHPSYLVTLVVGKFDVVTREWRNKPVLYYVPPGKQAEAEITFGNTRRMLDYFSDKIGVEYPWDKYAQVCAYQFGGGMENTSATTLTQTTLHDARSHLDTSSDDLISHELAHQWWGDLLTCREWAHTWLNEGFASYFEALWTGQDLGPDEFGYDLFGKFRGATNEQCKRGPVVDRNYAREGDMFNSRVYPKGAWVLHMLHERLGDELFWTALNQYCTQFALHAVETDDLRRVIEQVSGQSFERFFYDWTERPGHPVVELTYEWNEEDKTADIVVKQTPAKADAAPENRRDGEPRRRGARAGGAGGGQARDGGETPDTAAASPPAEPFHFPLVLEFRFEHGDPLIVRRDVTQLETEISAVLPARPTMLRVDPDYSVLMELTENKPRELWVEQLEKDPHVVGRIRAARQIEKLGDAADKAALARALGSDAFWGIKNEIAAALGRLKGDLARDALIAAVQDSNPKVRRACIDALGGFSKDPTVAAAMQAVLDKGDPSERVEAAAIEAYASAGGENVLAMAGELLTKPEQRERIQTGALAAAAKVKEPAAVELLLEWAASSKPPAVRRAALAGLGDAVETIKSNDELAPRVVAFLTECVGSGDRRLRGSAIRTLGDLGERSKPALDALRKLTSGDASEFVKRSARSAIEKIEPAAAPADRVAALEKEIEELKKERDDLRARIEALREPAKHAAAGGGGGDELDPPPGNAAAAPEGEAQN